MTTEIYVALLDECTPVWRPTLGEHLWDNVYRVLPTLDYDPARELWDFQPGAIVRCVLVEKAGRAILVADQLDDAAPHRFQLSPSWKHYLSPPNSRD